MRVVVVLVVLVPGMVSEDRRSHRLKDSEDTDRDCTRYQCMCLVEFEKSIPLCFDLTVGRYLRYRYPGTPGMPLHTGVPGPHWASGSEARVLGLYCGSRYLPGYSGVPGYPGSGRTWAPPRIPGYAPMPSRSYRRYPGTRLLFGAAEVQGKMEWECGMHTPVPGVPG